MNNKHRNKIRRAALLVSIFFITLGAVVGSYIYLRAPQQAEAAWYNTGGTWNFRKKLTIQESKIPGAGSLTDFPVLIKVRDTQIANALQSTGNDLLFTSADGTTKLDHEIELFNQTTGDLIVWVQVPTVSKTANTEIFMYYGNSTASSQQNVNGTWDANFTMVQHMEENPGTTCAATQEVCDSTSNGNNLDANGSLGSSSRVDSKMGYGYTLNGSSDYLSRTTAVVNNASAYTVCAWFSSASTSVGKIYAEANSTDVGNYIYMSMNESGQGGKVQYAHGTIAAYGIITDSNTTTNDSWHQACIVQTSTSSRTLYVDGASAGTDTTSTAAMTMNRTAIGAILTAAASQYYSGKLDELKVSNTNRAADWITAEYNNQNDPSSFVTFGAQVKYPISLDWKLDEAQGTSAYDASGEGNTGTLTNTPTWRTDGDCVSGSCLLFDGSNDHVVKAYSNDGDLDPGTGDMSVSLWFRHGPTISATQFLMARFSGSGYKVYMKSTGVVCLGIDADSTWTPTDEACTTNTFNDNKWHHFVGVKSGTSSLTAYVDGRQDGTPDASITASTISGSSPSLYVGIDSNGTSSPWAGFIDEVKFYSSALSASEVRSQFSAAGVVNGIASQISGQKSQDNLSSGLVGYWKFDESAANSCTGGVNDSCDSSGYGSDGAWSGNTTTSTTAKFNRSVVLDGTNDYIDIGNPTAIEVTSNFTISVWVNLGATGIDHAIATRVSAGQSNYYLGVNSSNQAFFRINGTTTATSTSTLSANTWYHVVGTYVPGQSVKIYINGRQESETTASVPTSINSFTQNLVIGETNDGFDDFNGRVDELRIYNRTLSSKDVSQLYEWGPGPIALWTMEEGSGQSITDVSGSGNNVTGTLGSSGSVFTDDPTWAPGKFGKGLFIDGTDDYVDFGNISQINGVSMLTLSGWMRKTALGNYLFLGKQASATNGLIIENYNTGVVYFDVSNGGTSYGTVSFEDTNWHYYTMVFDGTQTGNANRLKGFIDGIQQTLSFTGTIPTTTTSNTASFYIGRDLVPSFARGWVDHVSIYNYPRTPKQIMQDMYGSIPNGVTLKTTPTGYWKFSEGSGTSASDSSGNSNTLTLSSSSWTQSGKSDKAWNGTGSVWLTRADDDDFDFAAADEFSISMWFKSDSATNPASAAEYLLEKGTITNTGTAGYALYANTSGNIVFGVKDDAAWGASSPNTPSPDDTATSTTDIYDGTWHQIVAVKTGTSRIDLYVDGKLNASDTSIAATATLANSIAVRVGDDDADSANSFNGDLDEVKIYRYALNAEDVKQEYTQNSGMTLGSTSTASDGTTKDNSGSRAYCIPGDTTSCSAPVGEWLFEEGTGTSTKDTSGGGFTGTLTNGPTWSPGKYGKAINFDGGNDEVVTTYDIAETAAYSLSMWVYPRSQATDDTFASWGSSGTNGLYFGSSGQILWCNDGACGGTASSTNSALTLNAWNFITATYNGSGTAALYVNGRNVTSDGTLSETNNVSPFVIGQFEDGTPANAIDGLIDNVRIYDYVRTPAQIAWEYNKGAPIGHWKFNECTGSTANDSSGNSYSGTITIGGTGTYTSTGNCNSGTSTESWYSGTTGKYGSSIALDGTNDNISVGDNTIHEFSDGNDFSIALWINGTLSGTGTVLAKKTSTSNTTSGYDIRLSSSGQLDFYASDGTNQYQLTKASAVSSNTWTHVVVVYDEDSTTNTDLYINGSKSSATATGTLTSVGNVGVNSVALKFGSESDDQDYFPGRLDDIRLYNYAVTADQIKTIMNENAAVHF